MFRSSPCTPALFLIFAVRLASEARHCHFFLLLVVCLCMTNSGAQIHTEGLPGFRFPLNKSLYKCLAEIVTVQFFSFFTGLQGSSKAVRPESAESLVLGLFQSFAFLRRSCSSGEASMSAHVFTSFIAAQSSRCSFIQIS